MSPEIFVQVLLDRNRRRRLKRFTKMREVETILANLAKNHNLTDRRGLEETLSFLVNQDVWARHEKGETLKEIAEDYGVTFQAIWWRVCRWQEALYVKEYSEKPPPPSFQGPTDKMVRQIYLGGPDPLLSLAHEVAHLRLGIENGPDLEKEAQKDLENYRRSPAEEHASERQ